MNSEALLLQDKDASVTAFGSPAVPTRWQRPIYQGPGLAGDIFTATVVFTGLVIAIVEPTSPLITVFPQKAPTVPLDIWVEVDVRFPPKKTRTVAGRIMKRGQARFKTAFGDELVDNRW